MTDTWRTDSIKTGLYAGKLKHVKRNVDKHFAVLKINSLNVLVTYEDFFYQKTKVFQNLMKEISPIIIKFSFPEVGFQVK